VLLRENSAVIFSFTSKILFSVSARTLDIDSVTLEALQENSAALSLFLGRPDVLRNVGNVFPGHLSTNSKGDRPEDAGRRFNEP